MEDDVMVGVKNYIESESTPYSTPTNTPPSKQPPTPPHPPKPTLIYHPQHQKRKKVVALPSFSKQRYTLLR